MTDTADPDSCNGHPTKYRDVYDEQAFKLALLGATDAEMADFFGVCESTFYLWKNEHESFSESINAGKLKADAEIAYSLFDRARGATWEEEQAFKVKTGQWTETIEVVTLKKAAPPDTQAASLWLRNRASGKWREKVINEHTRLNGGPIVSADLTLTPQEAKDLSQALDDEC